MAVGVGVGNATGSGVEDGVGAGVGRGAAQPMAKAQIRTAANGFMSPPTDPVSVTKVTMRGPVRFRKPRLHGLRLEPHDALIVLAPLVRPPPTSHGTPVRRLVRSGPNGTGGRAGQFRQFKVDGTGRLR